MSCPAIKITLCALALVLLSRPAAPEAPAPFEAPEALEAPKPAEAPEPTDVPKAPEEEAPEPSEVIAAYFGALKKERASAWNPKLPLDRYQSLHASERTQCDKARTLFEKKKYLAAAAGFEKFKAQFPDSSVLAYAGFMRGLCLHRAKDFPQAIKAYQEVLADQARETEYAPAALYHLGLAQLESGNESGDEKAGRATLKKLAEDDAYRQHPLTVKAAKLLKDLEKMNWRTVEALEVIRRHPFALDGGIGALLFLSRNEHADVAEKMILEYCKAPEDKGRCEGLLRVYLTSDTRAQLSPKAKAAIEDFAWYKVNNKQSSLRTWWEAMSSENHFVNNRRIYYLSLAIVRMSPRYGPKAVVKYHGGRRKWSEETETTVEERYQAWTTCWIHYLRNRALYGLDGEVAQAGEYGRCTFGAYLDIRDLTDDEELRRIADSFLTLYWAEVAAEFEPKTGERAGLAATRNYYFKGHRTYWAKQLLYTYGWHSQFLKTNNFAGEVSALVSPYRPPEIVTAIASNPARGEYLATSRRCGMVESAMSSKGVFGERNNSHLRRDNYYTPDYALSTMAYAPHKYHDTHISLTQSMGVMFASNRLHRIVFVSNSGKGVRALNGITGAGVSVIAHDLKSRNADGIAIFLSKGLELSDDRIEQEYQRIVAAAKPETPAIGADGGLEEGDAELGEDPEFEALDDPPEKDEPAEKALASTEEVTWIFARGGNAYAAVFIPGGYAVKKEGSDALGYRLEMKDRWAAVVVQMGRAKDYESFAAFRQSVKENPLTYEGGKLTYTSEAGQVFEYWGQSKRVPRIDGQEIDYNPAKAYSSPYLSMVHNEEKAVISYPGYEDVVLDFSLDKTKKRPILIASYSGEEVDFLPKAKETKPMMPTWHSEKTDTWHGHKRHHLTVDGCKAWVVEPRQALPSNPWTWCMAFPDAFTERTGVPQLLEKGFHHLYIEVGNTFGCPAALKHLDAFYAAVAAQGLARKGTLIGLSRGGLYAYNWARRNTDKVVCIYGDAPVCDFKSWPAGKGKGTGSANDWNLLLKCYDFKDEAEALAWPHNPIDTLAPLAKAGIPLIHVVGDVDDAVPAAENTAIVEKRYQALGAKITVFHKPKVGHHPHGLDDPKPVVELILRYTQAAVK